uniref:50S ribosomal protein L35 n=1 Tax=Oryza punctata TaxID=4537 RepID=A0A0E0LE02_ORYPU
MAMSLSLARVALPPLLQQQGAATAAASTRKLHSGALAFPAKSFFGAPLAAAAAVVVSPASSAAASPLRRRPSSASAVVAAGKGYKMKTHKASAKRFRVTGRGKIVRRRAGKQHLLSKKNTKRRKRLSKMIQVNKSDYNNVTGALPYLKVNRNAE